MLGFSRFSFTISARTLGGIENGEVAPRAYTLQMIAKALDVGFTWFVDHTNDNKEIQQVNNNMVRPGNYCLKRILNQQLTGIKAQIK
ncbi:MAG: helix-turn-helix domain-containing protein [Candidatus Cyclobacteriaceae bacterium M3_2C_046]